MEAEGLALIRNKTARARGSRRPREQKGTALVRADMRAFGAFRRLKLQRRAADDDEHEMNEEQNARAFDVTCGWRSQEVKMTRYLYLGRFVGQEALHARLAVCVLAESTGLLARFVKHEGEPLPAGQLEQLMTEYRNHFKQWLLERLKQM